MKPPLLVQDASLVAQASVLWKVTTKYHKPKSSKVKDVSRWNDTMGWPLPFRLHGMHPNPEYIPKPILTAKNCRVHNAYLSVSVGPRRMPTSFTALRAMP